MNVDVLKSEVQHYRTRLILVFVGFAVFAVCAWLGWRTNATVDNDTYGIENTFRLLLDGTYQPSRTSGFPAYEFLGALAWNLAGRGGAMALSISLSALALVLFIRPMRVLRSWIGLACWWLLLLTPIVLTNASAVMETSMLLAVVAALSWVLSAPVAQRPLGVLVFVILGAALTLTRPDALLLVLATSAAMMCSTFAMRAKFTSAASLVGGSLVGLAMVVYLSKGRPFQSQFVTPESPVRRLLRGAIGAATAFSPLGSLALAVLAVLAVIVVVRVFRRHQDGSGTLSTYLDDERFMATWLLASLLLYGFRFIVLSDEIEYLLPLVAVIAVSIPSLVKISRPAAAVALVALAGMTSTTFVVVSFLQRSNPWDREPRLAVAVQRGGFIQDLQVRTANSTREKPEYKEFVTQSAPNLAASIDSGQTVLLAKDNWNYVLNPGYVKYFVKATQIAGCDELTTGSLIPGWRVSQATGDFGDIEAFNKGELMTCDVVAQLTPDTVTPVGNGIVSGASGTISR